MMLEGAVLTFPVLCEFTGRIWRGFVFVLELGSSQDQRHCTSLSTFIKTHGRFQIYQQKSIIRTWYFEPKVILTWIYFQWKSWKSCIFAVPHGTTLFGKSSREPHFLWHLPVWSKQADDPEAKTQASRHTFGQKGIWWWPKKKQRSVVWLRGVQSYRRSCHILSHFCNCSWNPNFVVAVVMAI